MDLYLLDKSRTPIYIIDDYVSLVWTERFQEPGEFELRLKPTRLLFSDFKVGYYLTKSDSSDAMIIEYRELSNDSEEGKFLDIKGRSVSSILDRRVDLSHALNLSSDGAYTLSGEVLGCMMSIVEDNAVNAIIQTTDYAHTQTSHNLETGEITRHFYPYNISAPQRNIPELVLGDYTPSDVMANMEISDKSMTVIDVLKKICEEYRCGFKVTLNPDTKKFEFVALFGTDRTLGQTENDPLYFSEEMYNLLYTNYYEDSTTYKNTAIVFGSSGPAYFAEHGITPIHMHAMFEHTFPGFYDLNANTVVRYTEPWTASSLSGLSRREVAVESDASLDNPPNTTYGETEEGSGGDTGEDTGEGGTTDSETQGSYVSPIEWVKYCQTYINKIFVDGLEALRSFDYRFIKDANGEIDTAAVYKYGTDYFLGDVVECDIGYGITSKSLIDEVVYSYDEDGIVVTPNFRDIDEDLLEDSGDYTDE